MTVELGSLVREKWAALLADCFDISQKDAHRVELESSNLTASSFMTREERSRCEPSVPAPSSVTAVLHRHGGKG